MPRTKGAKNKVYKRKVTMALEKSSEAIVAISEIESEMTQRQRLLFESLMMGDDELVAAIKSGSQDFYKGIAKKVYLKDGSWLATTKLDLSNVSELDPPSYKRLLSICQSQVRDLLGTDDYQKYTLPIREYIKRLSPLALGTIADIAQNGLKEENRLKAAKDLLDRAGEKAVEPEKDIVVPVQVNIMLTSSDGRELSYTNSQVRAESK